MASIFLCRESRLFTKYTDCTAVSMTGQVTAYGSITGAQLGNTVAIPGSALLVGTGVTFTTLTGGAGLTTGVKYYVVSVAGTNYQLATSQGGTAINFTTDITAGTLLVQTDELMVWSSEFRDIFGGMGIQGAVDAGSFGGTSYTATLGAPQGYGIYADPNQPIDAALVTSGGGSVSAYLAATPKGTVSDEVGHASLRQTFLARTFWKFTMSTAPTTLYAQVMEGDIISNTAPNTP